MISNPNIIVLNEKLESMKLIKLQYIVRNYKIVVEKGVEIFYEYF